MECVSFVIELNSNSNDTLLAMLCASICLGLLGWNAYRQPK